MRKQIALLKALIMGTASIEFINKRSVRRTPGEVTDCCGHQ
jgi:hypothetical protein